MERYESDVEEERSWGSSTKEKEVRDQVMVRLSEGFLEEIEDVSGKV